MRTQTDAPQIVLKAQHTGDVLRIARSVHPQSHRLDSILDAEAAVAESARLLENVSREHLRNLTRLNVLRQRANLNTIAVPEPVEITAPEDTSLVGRVVRRERLTSLNKTSGIILLDSGEEVAWTAAASYVDALDALFNGIPVQVTGPFLSDGSLSIQGAMPAPRAYWRTGEDFEAVADLGGMTVMAAGLLKKDLAKEHGWACQVCGHLFTKLTQASIADLVNDRPALVCRPCKEDWNQSRKAGA